MTERRRTSWIKKILLAVLSPLIALGLLEGGLRLWGSFEGERSVDDLLYGKTPLGINPGLFVEDPDLGWRVRPSTDWGIERRINAAGFRGPERPLAKPANTTRIACLGDSVTFGWSQLESETYPFVLQDLLDRAGLERRFEVFDFGVPGYTTHQARRLLESDVLAYQPDVVTLLFGWNDTHQSTLRRPDRDRPQPNAFAHWTHDTIGWSRLYQVMRRWALQIAAGDVTPKGEVEPGEVDPATVRVPMAHFLENLESLVVTCRGRSIQPVLITEPHNAKYIDYPLQEQVVRAVRSGAAQADVILADFERLVRRRYLSSYLFAMAQVFAPLLPLESQRWMDALRASRLRADAELRGKTWTGPAGVPDRELFIDDVHPNKEGHHLLAYTLYETLRVRLWPELPPRTPAFFVNLGQSDSRDGLLSSVVGAGWGPLPTGTWQWWRPILGESATLHLPIVPQNEARLRLRARSTAQTPRALELELGSASSQSFAVPTRWTTLEWTPPKDAWNGDRSIVLHVQGLAEADRASGIEVSSLLIEVDAPFQDVPLSGGPR